MPAAKPRGGRALAELLAEFAERIHGIGSIANVNAASSLIAALAERDKWNVDKVQISNCGCANCIKWRAADARVRELLGAGGENG